MDHTQREIRNEIEATRADMVNKIAALEERVGCTIQGVKRSFDFKYQTEQHPWLAVGLSVAAGYLLSRLILGRPTPKMQIVLPDNWANRNERAGGNRSGMLASLTGMLSGVVSATAVSLAREYASGLLFKREQNGQGSGQGPERTAARDPRDVTYPN